MSASDRDVPAALTARCRQQQAAMLALIEELVVENSFTENSAGGAAVAHILARELRAIPGLDVALCESTRFAPHVLVRTAAARAESAGCVALVGHLDTVFPPGTFEGWRVERDIARGPGVLDMKGGLVVALFALRLLADHGALAGLPLRLVIVSDEEVGSPEGADVIAGELAGAACALVFEAGRHGDAIITARKGTGAVTVSARGEGAIVAVLRMIDAAQALTDYGRGLTVNAGTISGDRDSARALFDLRFETIAEGEALVARLQAAADALCNAGAALTLEGGVKRPPLERTAANLAVYREYAAAAASAGLGSGEAGLVGGGSDAATTAALGIPSIDGLGPRGKGFHTHDELIEIPTLGPRLEALVRFLWGRHPRERER